MLKFLKNLFKTKKVETEVEVSPPGYLVTDPTTLKAGDVVYISKEFKNCLEETYKPDYYTVVQNDPGTELDLDLRHKSGVELSPIWTDSDQIVTGAMYKVGSEK